MKIGSFVYATDQGLGVLAKSFYDAGVVTDVMVINHGRHINRAEWYPGARHITDLRSQHQRADMTDFAAQMDAMLFFETPFVWPVIDNCKRAGVPTALMPMFECEFAKLPATPDLIINPSHLDQDYYPMGVHIPVPVEYPWTQRERAETFIHNSGHGGLKGRNGTAEFLEAAKHIKSKARLVLRVQESNRVYWAAEGLHKGNPHPLVPSNVEVVCGTVPYGDLFATGDVFVFPEKFNGLSLPLQEARAAGMLVMCGNRYPMNMWLPVEPLIPIDRTVKSRIGPPYNEFDEAVIRPRDIAAKIDEYYGQDISEYSRQGKAWAESMSWKALKPLYMAELEKLCASST